MDKLVGSLPYNESDVEQKIILPFITKSVPEGLGITIDSILTKSNIKGLTIGKGNTRKNHFPDYLIVINGIPVLIIEAKASGENLEDAYHEACLYALELNMKFPTNLNPLTKVISTDGTNWLAGEWDSHDAKYDLKNINPYSSGFSDFIEEFCFSNLDKISTNFISKTQNKNYWRPRRMMGSKTAQNEEVGHNTFGSNLISRYGHIFNPNTLNDRKFIVKEGYIHSKRRDRYVQPIDEIIRAARPASLSDSKLIEDTENPKEIIKTLKNGGLEHKVILLIGSVGSGKTTFIDYLKEVALPTDLVDSTLWLRVNMNESPVSSDEIYNWLRLKIISECRSLYQDVDFDDIDILRKLYSVEINKFNKGEAKLLDTDGYNRELYNLLRECKKNVHETAKSFTRYCGTERGKLVIIVLDNCDKRTLDEQLLMFEAAQWLQKEFRSLIILPLREETYDNYRDRPPLDTALKDMVFRIEPPLFQNVLQTRVQLVLNRMAKIDGGGSLSYSLPNGFNVEYGKNEQSFYLTSIVKSIFVHDAQIRKMIVGLSGRNIRRALEIFLEFCTSGHITEDEFFKIRQSEGKYALPLHIVTRVLLRLNRRFYDSDNSYLKNVFSISQYDPLPNYFTRYIILRWFHNRFNQTGPRGLKGYFPMRDLKRSLVKYGISAEIISREVDYLVNGFCLVSEDFRVKGIEDNELLSLASAGFVHLDMLSNISYLAAVAEDTHFTDEKIAQKITDRIGLVNSQYNKEIVISNAKDLVDYLEVQRRMVINQTKDFVQSPEYEELSNISQSINTINNFSDIATEPNWAIFEQSHSSGDVIEGTVNGRDERFGVFVDLADGIKGLIYKNKLPPNFKTSYVFRKGAKLRVRIENDFNAIEKKINLSLIDEDVKEPK